MPGIMKGALHAFYIYSCTGHILHTVSFHFLEEEPLPPRSTPRGVYRPVISYEAVPLLSFGLLVQHSLTHSLIADRSMVAGHVQMDHT